MKKIEFDHHNIGGIYRIYAIPESSFLRVREDAISGRGHLDLIRTGDIIDLYVVDDSVVFTEEQSRSAPGAGYDVTIAGIIPKSNAPNRKQFLELENKTFLVLFLDNNSNVRLAGTEENRLYFKRKETTGTLNSRNQIEFEFKGKQVKPCYFIDTKELPYL